MVNTLKKYAIRTVGALCILGALALMFMGSWIKLKDVDRRGLREIRDQLKDFTGAAKTAYISQLQENRLFKDEAKDCDLPASSGKVKAGIKEVDTLIGSVLDENVSFREVLDLSVRAPRIVDNTEELLESDCADSLFTHTAYYLWIDEYRQDWELEYSDIMELARKDGRQFVTMSEDIVDGYEDFSSLVTLLTAVLCLIILLGVAAAATHICNRVRWLKYIFLIILVLLVAGTLVGTSIASEMVADLVGGPFDDLTLSITVVPFFAIALMAVPVVLDVAFERKKEIN